jgi:hypothetical protein
MEDLAKVKTSASVELVQIRGLISKWREHDDSTTESGYAVLRDEIESRISSASSIFDTLSTADDSESTIILSEFRSLHDLFEAGPSLIPAIPEMIESVSGSTPFDGRNDIYSRTNARMPRTIIGDVCWSLGHAVLICIFFAIIWTQYARTH